MANVIEYSGWMIRLVGRENIIFETEAIANEFRKRENEKTPGRGQIPEPVFVEQTVVIYRSVRDYDASVDADEDSKAMDALAKLSKEEHDALKQYFERGKADGKSN